MNLYQLVREFGGNSCALRVGRSEVSYSSLLSEAISTRNDLRGKGFREGHLVALAINHPVGYVATFLACSYMGLVALPIPPNLSADTVNRILSETKAGFVGDGRVKLGSLAPPCCSPGDVIHFTSGSMGAKKLVVRPLGNLLDEAKAVSIRLGLRPGAKVLVTSPLQHSFGCGLLRASLVSGATVVAPSSGDILKRVVQIRKILEEDGVDYIFGVPSLYRLVARSRVSPKFRTLCFAGGESLHASDVSRWAAMTGLKLKQEYGLGEGGIVTIATEESSPLSLGKPVPGVLAIRVNIGSSEPGELVVYRPHPPTRYLLDEDTNTFLSDGGIATGDLVSHENGEYFFKGRKKSIIVVGGMKVVPQEIEDAIRSTVPVREVAVIPGSDSISGEVPIAFVVADFKCDEERLQVDLAKKLEKYKIPRRIIQLADLPRTETGKVDKHELAKLL